MTKRSPEDILSAFFDTFDAEVKQESAAGITSRGVSGLDLMLKTLISAVLIDQSRIDKAYDAFGGPLSDFSDKWRMSYCLGLITKNEARELKILGSIRNQCNHEVESDFNSGRISDKCRELELGTKLYSPETIPVPRGQGTAYPHGYDEEGYPLIPAEELMLQNPNDPSARFVASVNVMMGILSARLAATRYSDDSLTPHRNPPKDFDYPEEIRDIVIEAAEKQLLTISRIEEQYSALAARAATFIHDIEPLNTIDPQEIRKTRIIIDALKYGGETIRRSRQHLSE